MWVCVRRPSGNRRPSAFSYKSYSLLLWSSRVSQTLQRSRTLGGFLMGHTARIHEHTRADKGSDSQRPGQICCFPPWRQRERCRVTYKHRSECSRKGGVQKYTFVIIHIALHDLLSSEETKGNVGEVWRSCFSWVMVIIKLQQTEKKHINIRGVPNMTFGAHFNFDVTGKINKTASFLH